MLTIPAGDAFLEEEELADSVFEGIIGLAILSSDLVVTGKPAAGGDAVPENGIDPGEIFVASIINGLLLLK